MTSSLSSSCGHGGASRTLLAPLGAVRPLDRMMRKDDPQRVPRAVTAQRGVARHLPVVKRAFVISQLKIWSRPRERDRLAGPWTWRRIRLAAVDSGEIGSCALLHLGF